VKTNSLLAKITAPSIALLDNPPTAQDTAGHTAQFIAAGQLAERAVLVAHSQSNLFVSTAYDAWSQTLSKRCDPPTSRSDLMHPDHKTSHSLAASCRHTALWLCLSITVLALTACGGGKSSESTTTPPAERGMKEQLAALEKAGELPALDRSTDIAGPDTDRNGIRDDIDAYIAALPVTDAMKKATRQVARVQQEALLIDLNDRVTLLALSNASMASTACMSETAEAGLPADQQNKASNDGYAITLKIEAITANTPERADRYLAYMLALHGTTTTYPTGRVCED
jgi:hypothetical protein